MKFTPNIDKNVKLHDASTKVHISFDDEPAATPKKRSHPAHDNGNDKKKSKTEKSKDKKSKHKEEKDKKKKSKDEKKKTKEAEKVATPKEVPVKASSQNKSTAVSIVSPTENKPAAVTIDTPSDTKPKVRGSNFTPKKVKTKKHAPPPKKTQEEILARVAAIRKKKQLKRNSKMKVNGEVIAKPTFQLIPAGLSDKLLPTKDLGNFVLFALSETNNLPWCNLIHKTKIEKLVMVFAQGINCTDFGISFNGQVPSHIDLDNLKETDSVGKASMPFLCKQSKYMITHEISGSKGKFNSPVADILQCNMSNSKKERLLKEMNQRLVQYKDNMRDYYILSLEEMRKADYPIPPFLDPSVVLPEGWKETHPSETETTNPKKPKRIIAVDCEMVLTAEGSKLARITLIDEDGSLLLDELVKPELPIIDYLTRYSGITPAAMKTATCSLRRAQKHVRKLVNHDVILVGHGLENDLKALQLAHPYCVDTSLLYDHHRGPPYKPSLRFLARNYLKRFIQDRNDDHVGHDSVEDARATLDLFKLKLENKPRFGRFKYTELVMDRLSANRPPRSSAILESSSNNSRSFGSTQNGPYYRVDTDEELVDLTLEKMKDTNFLFTRFQVADTQGLEQKDKYNYAPDIVPNAAKSSSDSAVKLQKLDSYLRKLYTGLPENSFLVVTGGVCDVPEYKKLYDQHKKSQEGSGNWTDEEQALLCKYAANARTSASFFIFKPMA